MASSPDTALTIYELADYLKLSKSTLYHLARRGDVPGQKIDRHWRSRKETIDGWLDQQGESGAADLLRKLGGDYGEKARDLAYRLYNICERKGWASEALAYNSLVIAWPEISKLAQQESPQGKTQAMLFDQQEAKE